MFDKELLNYIKDKKYYLILNVLFNVLAFIFNILITSSILYLIYNTINKLNNHLIYSLISLFIGLLFKIIFTLLANYYSHKLANYVIMKLRIDTYSKYLRLNTNIPFTISEMAELSTEGIEQLRLYYEFYLPSFFYAMIAPILLFMLFLCFDYKVALVYLICIPLIPISIILVSKGAKKIFNKYWDIYLGLGDSFLDNVRGLKELKIFLYDEERTNDMALKSEEFRKITMKVLVMQLYSVTIMDLVAYGGAGLGIVLTLISMQNGLDLYVALFMILIGAEFFLPLRRLGSAFHVAMNGATAGKKVIKLLNEEEKVANILIDNKIDNILIKDLSFNYKDKDLILNNINMQLNIGLYSIVGISGSGKSTIAKILANINNNYKGHIILNNNLELNKINVDSFYKKVCYVANTTYIMHKSIKDEFLFYNNELSENEMWRLLKLVKMDEVIRNNGGLDFIIKDEGSNISGGEKQRLILAYYLSKPYDFYIFDEATSNIDKDSEEIILEIIKKLALNNIVLNITHRLKNVLASNYIYFLKNSKIVEEGSPKKLLNENSEFKELYLYQSSLEEIKK